MPVLLQISLLLALAVVLLITFLVGLKAEAEARDSLEDQIERHLTDESAEAAATIGERFRRIQNAVLDVTAFAIRDALQEVSVSTINEESFMANDDRLVVIHNDEGHAMMVLLQTFSPMPNADRYLTLCVRTILKFCMCVYFSNIFHTSNGYVCQASACGQLRGEIFIFPPSAKELFGLANCGRRSLRSASAFAYSPLPG